MPDRPSACPFDFLSVRPSACPTFRLPDRPSVCSSDLSVQSSFYLFDLPSAHPTFPSNPPSTVRPSVCSSDLPSARPSTRPTFRLLIRSSVCPFVYPSDRPCSPTPSDRPSVSPFDRLSVYPSDRPSVYPSDRSSVYPSDRPSIYPSDRPSVSPFDLPPVCPNFHLSDFSVRPSVQHALSGSQPYQTDSPCELPSSQKQCGVTGSGSNLDFFAGSSANRTADRLTVKRARKKTRGTFASVRTRIPMGESPDAPAVHVEPTIVGGFDAVPNQICWQANLVSVSWLGPESCGGVIIGPRTILTAAHCFTDPSTGERVPFYNVAVHVGALQRHGFHADKNESNGGCPEVYQLSRLTVHEDFDPESFNNDVTLLTLNRPIDFNNKPCACTACLEDLEPKPGDTCIVSGTGREFNGDNNTTVPLKWLPVEVLSQESDQCGQISNTTDLDLFVCAGPVFGENACQGDSGGPLVCLNPFNEFYLAATVSYGSNICAEDLGTEYTKTKAFLPWIRRNALPEDVL
ncbi:putative Transmembrane protease serine 9 [Hypsibius exemplaris]|uniref:Transmembrane protease serine 9 n=1 Tax=Hypsibius exemplaris TaxID=2072580 RepID=A0A1W0WBE0_HYPEX|nr:putative Transmembrane protease serine 9 [Hypsibius exemplaris]